METQIEQMKKEKEKLANDMMAFSKKNQEYDAEIKKNQKMLLDTQKEVAAARNELKKILTQIDESNEVFIAREKAQADKLKAAELELDNRIAEVDRQEDEIIKASRSIDDMKADLKARLHAATMDRVKIANMSKELPAIEAKKEQNELLSKTLEIKEQKLNEREGLFKAKEEEIQTLKKQVEKEIAILNGKQKNVQAITDDLSLQRDKYVAECKMLEKREKAISDKEDELALALINVKKKQEENYVTEQSLKDTEFELKVLEAKIGKEIKKRRLEEELAKG